MTSQHPMTEADVLHLSAATRLASAADTATHGEYRIRRDPGDPRPLLRFAGRITEDGALTARPFRYHVYGGWFCPWSHRIAITRLLAGLSDIVTMSYVDNVRDGGAGRSGSGTAPTRSTASRCCGTRTKRPRAASTATCPYRRCGTG